MALHRWAKHFMSYFFVSDVRKDIQRHGILGWLWNCCFNLAGIGDICIASFLLSLMYDMFFSVVQVAGVAMSVFFFY